MGIPTGTDKPPATAVVDKDDRGVDIVGVRILRSGQRRGITRKRKAMIKRRSAIVPAVGHMKMGGLLARNPLKGAQGNALHAVMRGALYNLPDPSRTAALLLGTRVVRAAGHRRSA